MPGEKSIAIVSFNAHERSAVDQLLSDLASGAPSPWSRDGELSIRRRYGDEEWTLEHAPLQAQGNVIAAAQLAEFFNDRARPPDNVVFYGCAGATRKSESASAFLVKEANYLSLGTVSPGPNGSELVTLKNKWLCHLMPDGDDPPLKAVRFPRCSPDGQYGNLSDLTGIPTARVAATDKVLRIAPADPAPTPAQQGPPHDLFAKEEWSYAQGLAHVARVADPVIVEMESYGIGRLAEALLIIDRVVVLRITTDELTDHHKNDALQRDLLMQGRRLLGWVLAALYVPLDSVRA